MTYTTLERHDIEVPMAVCMAGMMVVLTRVATACHTAPWSEDMACLSHHAGSGAAFRCDAKQIAALSTMRGVRLFAWHRTALTTASRKLDTTRCGRTAKSDSFERGERHVESAPPSMVHLSKAVYKLKYNTAYSDFSLS